MKFTWEERDIFCGRAVRYPSEEFSEERCYIIGYVGGSSTKSKNSGVVLISMSDGMVGKIYSKEELVNELNEDKVEPIMMKTIYQNLQVK